MHQLLYLCGYHYEHIPVIDTERGLQPPFQNKCGAGGKNKEQELTLYRCAYELVNNALKYAEATHIDLQLLQDSHEVTLTISDNGKGMAEGGGMGLQNIRERIQAYHGTLRIVTSENGGTEINITLPL